MIDVWEWKRWVIVACMHRSITEHMGDNVGVLGIHNCFNLSKQISHNSIKMECTMYMSLIIAIIVNVIHNIPILHNLVVIPAK